MLGTCTAAPWMELGARESLMRHHRLFLCLPLKERTSHCTLLRSGWPSRTTQVGLLAMCMYVFFLIHSSSGEYLLAGVSNGSIRVHPLARPHCLGSLQAYWSLSMHDNHYGTVTQLATTFDDQYVLSGGADGNVFVYIANLPTAAEKRSAAAALLKVGSTLL